MVVAALEAVARQRVMFSPGSQAGSDAGVSDVPQLLPKLQERAVMLLTFLHECECSAEPAAETSQLNVLTTLRRLAVLTGHDSSALFSEARLASAEVRHGVSCQWHRQL